MGTNYYLRTNLCSCCKRFNEQHIGKSSAGWKFIFHATWELRSADDWFKEIENSHGLIFDEYGVERTIDEFKKLVTAKSIYASQKERYFSDDKLYWTDGNYDYSEHEFS